MSYFSIITPMCMPQKSTPFLTMATHMVRNYQAPLLWIHVFVYTFDIITVSTVEKNRRNSV